MSASNYVHQKKRKTKNVNPTSASWAIDSQPIRARGIIVKYPMQNENNSMRYKSNMMLF